MLFRNRSLLALVLAQGVSQLGSTMTFLALPWFVLATTGSAAKMGWVLAAELLPVAVFGIPSGSLVNWLGARRMMLVADALRAPLVMAVPLLWAAGHLSFPLLLLIVGGIGLFQAPYGGARSAITPEIVGLDETLVARVSALTEGTNRITMIAGPAAAGLLIGTIGVTRVLYIDAASYLLSFVLLALFVRGGKRVRAAEGGGGIFEGVRYLARDSLLGPTTLTIVGLAGFFQITFASLPVLAFDEFDRNARLAGWFFGAFGVGGLLGAVAAYRIVGRFDPLKLAGSAVVLSSLPLWALALPIPAWGVLLAMAAMGLWLPIVNAPMSSVLLVRTPLAIRAKIMTVIMTANALAGPLALVAAGPLIEHVGVRPVLGVSAAGLTVSALWFASIAWRHAGPTPEAVPELSAQQA